jgi:hypothetical protein
VFVIKILEAVIFNPLANVEANEALIEFKAVDALATDIEDVWAFVTKLDVWVFVTNELVALFKT